MSRSPDDFETLARAFAARDLSRAEPTECPNPELLFEAAAGGLELEQRLTIVDHVSGCAECSQAWRLAMELGARPGRAIERSHGTSIFPPAWMMHAKIFGRPQFAWAATVIVAVGIAAYLGFPVRQQPPQYRQAANPLAPMSLIAGQLARDRFLLRWSPGPPGSTYTLRLSTVNLDLLLFKEEITTTEFLVPDTVLAHVASGQQLLWQVETRQQNGQRVASATYTVILE